MDAREGNWDIAEISRQVDACEDPREGYAIVQERIRKIQDAGSQVPTELVRLERNLVTELMAASQGR